MVLNKKGQGGDLWYIIYFGFAAGLLGFIAFVSVQTYTVHSNMFELQNELVVARSGNQLDRSILDIAPDLEGFLSSQLPWSMKYSRGEYIRYSDEDSYLIMSELVPLGFRASRIRVPKQQDAKLYLVLENE